MTNLSEEQIDKLCEAAADAFTRAYVPYSHFPVGAAILMKNGDIVKGCNIENCSYPLSNCAERTAMFSAIAQGYKKDDMIAIAVAAPTENLTTPCGACRQVMMELMGPDTPVILTNTKRHKIFTASQLLPETFVL